MGEFRIIFFKKEGGFLYLFLFFVCFKYLVYYRYDVEDGIVEGRVRGKFRLIRLELGDKRV